MTALDDKLKELQEKRIKLNNKYREVSKTYWDARTTRAEQRLMDEKRGAISRQLTKITLEITAIDNIKTGKKIIVEKDLSVLARKRKKTNEQRAEAFAKASALGEQLGLPIHDPIKDKNPPGYIDNSKLATPGGYSVPTGQSSADSSKK